MNRIVFHRYNTYETVSTVLTCFEAYVVITQAPTDTLEKKQVPGTYIV